MTVRKEIGITIDWEDIVMDVLKLEKLGYTDITMQMQEKEERYINLKNTDAIIQLCEIANNKIINKSNDNIKNKKFEYKTFHNDNVDYLNELGEEGWEMCGITQAKSVFSITGYNTAIYLKREIID